MARIELAARDWHTLMLPLHHIRIWSWRQDLFAQRLRRRYLQPTDYKSVALPLSHTSILVTGARIALADV
jgi:hypothetical protein